MRLLAGGMEVYPCPLCGRRVNRRGAPFADPSQVEAHIDGARDAAHKGQSGAAHADEIEAEEVDPSQFGRGGSDGDSGSLPSVETVLTDRLDTGPTPVPNAVDMSHRMVESHMDRVEALEVRVEELHEEVEELQGTVAEREEQIVELRRAVEAVAEETVGLFGEAEITWES